MNRTMRLLMLAVLAMFAIWLSGCAEAAEEALEEATGLNWDLENCDSSEVNEDGIPECANAPVPDNWTYLFAVYLQDEDQISLMDQDFSVDVSMFEDILNFDEITLQVVFARVDEELDALRYANKVLLADSEIKLDTEAIEKMGPSIGSSGEGWYVCYAATKPFGYITGEVTDCNGNSPADDTVLVTATDGPFFTYARGAGSWALPSLNGKPALVNFDAGDCSGSQDAPVTDTGENPDPKDPGSEPESDNLDDGTDNGELPEGGEDQGTNIVAVGKVKLNEDQPSGGETGSGDRFEFDDGVAAWGNTGDCFAIYNDADDYGLLFPGGTDAGGYFAYISTGSPTQSGLQACTVMRTFNVSGYSKMIVSYDFISQEYQEWVGSAYNDVFTVLIQGETGYVVSRTINGDNNWDPLTPAEGVIGFIADSADAQYNPTSADPYSNGAYMLDGHLVWGGSDGNTPRGENDGGDVMGRVAEYPLPAGATTITVLITVSDVADAIYDSVAAIDYIEFQ